MSRVTSNKSEDPRTGGNSMLMGVLLGMLAGVALAAVLAWFILKSPSPFVSKEIQVKPAEIVDHPQAASAPVASSGVEDAKPRFEFYQVLTDKQEGSAPPKPVEQVKVVESRPAMPKYLQAASFSDAADAENLKATLAMKGLEASVQTVAIPGKGDMHRVRVGPFQNEQDLNSALATLRSSGLDAAQVR
ncbi:MAG: SPOR domain-containing protein [Gallionella sp.]|nr:SPOR domain-containing protein [Gallionella sp.]